MPLGFALLLVAAQAVTIVDGDTLRLDGERVRLIGVDAPEIHRAECPVERILGETAKAELARLTAGHTIHLERHGTDRYRRTWRSSSPMISM